MRAILLVLAACGVGQVLCAEENASPAVFRRTVPGSAVHTPRPWIVVSGRVTVKDGNTLVFADGLEVKLEEGPELDQLGKIGDSFYAAGREARAFLQKLIGDHSVNMYINAGSEEYRRGERVIGDCYVGDMNLGHELIKHGWALADHSITSPMEIIARENKRGLWRGEFVLPGKWRKGERLPGEDAAITKEEQSALWQLGGRFQVEDGHVVALSLQRDEVNEPALANLKYLPYLRSLSLGDPSDGAAITDALLSPLGGLSQLRSLRISGLHGVTDAALVHLHGLTQLERLEITHTRTINGSGLQHVRGLGQLQLLEFNHTPITDEGIGHLKELTNLKSLGLRASKITDRGICRSCASRTTMAARGGDTWEISTSSGRWSSMAGPWPITVRCMPMKSSPARTSAAYGGASLSTPSSGARGSGWRGNDRSQHSPIQSALQENKS